MHAKGRVRIRAARDPSCFHRHSDFSTAQRSAHQRIQLHFALCFFNCLHCSIVFYNIYTISNFDFVNFSPSTKTTTTGLVGRRNCLMLLLLYNVMICLLGWGCPTREFFTHLETYMYLYVTITGEGLHILTYDHRVIRILERATPTVTQLIRL